MGSFCTPPRIALTVAIVVAVVSLLTPVSATAGSPPIPKISDCVLPEVPPEGTIRLKENVAYNTVNGEQLLLDIARPKGAPPQGGYPLVIVLHGGAFIVGDKATGGGTAQRRAIQQLAGLGFAAVSANYRLTTPGKNPFPAAVQDVRCLVRWSRVHAAEYSIDPERIAITGVSAGGGLASSVALMSDGVTISGKNIDLMNCYSCEADHTPLGKVSSKVNRAVIYYGPSDFTIPIWKWKEMALFIIDYLGWRPMKFKQQTQDASPVLYVTAQSPPTLLLHGTEDDKVPYSQSVTLWQKLREQAVRNRLISLPGIGHSFLMFDKDYFRLPTEEDDLDAIPVCTDSDPSGTVCRMEVEDVGTVIKIVDAIETSSCTSLHFLEEMLDP